MKITEQEEGDTFNVDTEVLSDGIYVCVPCGDKQYFQNGETFPRCFNCIELEGNPEKLRKGLGLWELSKKSEGQAYQCPVCKQHYHDKSTAKACQTWCAEHGNPSPEISKSSVEQEA